MTSPESKALSVPADEQGSAASKERWQFLRDVAVFEFKMMLDNCRDFLLIPATLIAAGLDVAFKRDREGARFYKVLDWGRRSEEIINVYGALGEGIDAGQDFTVDHVIRQVEAVLVREYEKGGTAANLKAAVDRAIDEIQRKGAARRSRAGSKHRRGQSGG